MSDQPGNNYLKEKIIFFDGVCNLCNTTVDFFIRKDKEKKLRYASLQSEVGKSILDNLNVNQGDINTVYFLQHGELSEKSRALSLILKEIGGIYRIIGFIIEFLPWWITDKAYDFIAKNRYRWMGKRNTCRVPTESEKGLFMG